MRPHLFAPIAWPPRSPASSPPLHVLEPLTRAEAQGYAGVWLAEATPAQRGIGPLLHLAAAWLAARTQRIRIGVAGALLPSLHPLRLAEELAMLDALSAGRLCWAVEDTHDDPLLREQLAIVMLALTGESFAWDGAYFELPELRCLPAAVQRPHPPLSIRAGSDDAIVRAARAGRRFWNDPLAPVACVQ